LYELPRELLFPNVSTPTKIEQQVGELDRSLRNNVWHTIRDSRV